MKKSITIFLSILMVLTLALTGCSGEKTTLSGDDKSKPANTTSVTNSTSSLNNTSATASNEDKAELTAKRFDGLSFKVPEDFGDFTETQGVKLATNDSSTASITVAENIDLMGRRPENIDQDLYQEIVIPNYADVKFVEFKNDVEVGYSTAVYVHFTAKNAKGLEVEAYSYLVYLPADDGDGSFYSVMFAFTKDADNSIKSNIDAIKDSLNLDFDF